MDPLEARRDGRASWIVCRRENTLVWNRDSTADLGETKSDVVKGSVYV